MNVRRILGPLLVVLSLLVTACGSPATSGTTGTGTNAGGGAATQGGASQASTSAAASGSTIQFRMAWWGSKDRHDRTIKVIDLFQKENPNVKITYEFSAFTDYWIKLTTQAAGHNLPCLIQQDYAKIGEWVARDLLLPLDDYVQKGTIATKNVDKSYIDSGRLNGKLYAISLGTNTQALIFDPAMYQKANVPIPPNDWTWADFEKTIGQVKAKTGTYGMSTALDDISVFILWLRQHGKDIYSSDGSALGYDDDKLFVDYMTMIKRFMDEGVMPNRAFEVAMGNAPVEDDPIVKQQAATAYAWSNQVVAILAAAGGRPLQTGLLPRPSLSDPTGLYLKPSQFFSITKDCPNPDIAAKIIDMFTNSIPANQILAAERGVPISSEIRKAIEPQLQQGQKEAFKVVSLVEKNPGKLSPPDPPGSVEVNTKLYTQFRDQVLYGKLSPEDAAKQFRQQSNAILAKNKK